MKDAPSPEQTAVRDEETAARSPTAETLLSDLNGLSADRSNPELHEGVRDVGRLVVEASERGLIDSGVRDLRARDAAEAFVGTVIFATPLLVEDGVFDIVAYFLAFQLGLFPVFFLIYAAFVLGMILGLVYWAAHRTSGSHGRFSAFSRGDWSGLRSFPF